MISPAEADEAMQQAVLATLLAEHPVLLTLDDLYRERCQPFSVAERGAVDRAVHDLVAAGLVHRNGLFVVPSRAAIHFSRLEAR